jgi:hypothetical protein
MPDGLSGTPRHVLIVDDVASDATTRDLPRHSVGGEADRSARSAEAAYGLDCLFIPAGSALRVPAMVVSAAEPLPLKAAAELGKACRIFDAHTIKPREYQYSAWAFSSANTISWYSVDHATGTDCSGRRDSVKSVHGYYAATSRNSASGLVFSRKFWIRYEKGGPECQM